MIVIFLPLFFPVEGLTSPKLIDWLFLVVVGLVVLLLLPVYFRGFAVER